MTRRVRKLVLCVIAAGLLQFTGLWPAAAMDLSVTVTGVRSDKGHVLLALYDREDGFPDDEAAIARLVLPARIGEVSDRFSGLDPGEYAIAVLHDENDNRKLDFRFFIPREGYVFSNNVAPRMRAARFAEARFVVGPAPASISIELRY